MPRVSPRRSPLAGWQGRLQQVWGSAFPAAAAARTRLAATPRPARLAVAAVTAVAVVTGGGAVALPKAAGLLAVKDPGAVSRVIVVTPGPAAPSSAPPSAPAAPPTVTPSIAPTAAAAPATTTAARVVPSELTASGIPDAALKAYRRAQVSAARWYPGCHLSWTLLAAIGRVESNHGRFAGAVLSRDGRSRPAIIGLRLDGSGATSVVPDSDHGRLDGDPQFDRAVGAMQFLPATWRGVAVDGDGDGLGDPQDINDAAVSAAVYLCAYSGNLATPAGRGAAVFRYNHSNDYVALVLGVADAYSTGTTVTVPTPVVPSAPKPTPRLAPDEPATPVTPPAVATPAPPPAPTTPPAVPSASASPTGSPSPSPLDTPPATPDISPSPS